MQRIACSIFLCSLPVLAMASGLRVPIDNGLGTPGNAGGAALAEDASTGVTNPAGLVRIDHPELVVGVSPVFSNVQFDGVVTIDNRANLPVPTPNPDPVVYTGDTTTNIVAPLLAIHYSQPLTDRVYYAFGLTNPFGQGVEFEDNSIVNSTVTQATLITWNISNSLGIKITEEWSIGAGFDSQYLNYENNNIYPSFRDSAPDIYTRNTATGWAFGYHAGILWQTNNEMTRIGFNYRSQVDHKGEGRSYSTQDFSTIDDPNRPNSSVENDDFTIEFSLPPIFTLSGYHHITERIALMGTAEYLMWSVFDDIVFENMVNQGLDGGDGTLVIPQSYNNSWVFNVGSYYHMTEALRLGIGVRIDNTPLNEKYRNVEFPESDFWALGVSAGYRFNKVARIEIGYTHSFYDWVDIDTTQEASEVTNTGKGKLSADLINTQLTINLAPMFGKPTALEDKEEFMSDGT